jgi:hypothetical protein
MRKEKMVVQFLRNFPHISLGAKTKTPTAPVRTTDKK